jgi:mannan endo-1,6-alpha-mannosidase
MFEETGDQVWQQRINGILTTASGVFFKNGAMSEVACETNNNCDTDQQSFKGYLARWLGHTTKVAPFTQPTISKLLASSGQAAVSTCTGGQDGQQCGLKWTGPFDGIVGVGEQMSVLEMIQSNLQPYVSGPLTAKSGGSSQGNPSAGGGGDNAGVTLDTISTSDKAGAGILTTLVLIATFGGAWWMASK